MEKRELILAPAILIGIPSVFFGLLGAYVQLDKYDQRCAERNYRPWRPWRYAMWVAWFLVCCVSALPLFVFSILAACSCCPCALAWRDGRLRDTYDERRWSVSSADSESVRTDVVDEGSGSDGDAESPRLDIVHRSGTPPPVYTPAAPPEPPPPAYLPGGGAGRIC
ncbi:hypothetical protein TruAng_000678 [Truncatella angustata]|nr:hypothetical protein TruAng_000678 [Truncatella angustata]